MSKLLGGRKTRKATCRKDICLCQKQHFPDVLKVNLSSHYCYREGDKQVVTESESLGLELLGW